MEKFQTGWKSVFSGVPQGSVLGPLLFVTYINDLDNNITSNVLKFADDTNVFRKVNTDGNIQHLQNDLDRWCGCSCVGDSLAQVVYRYWLYIVLTGVLVGVAVSETVLLKLCTDTGCTLF